MKNIDFSLAIINLYVCMYAYIWNNNFKLKQIEQKREILEMELFFIIIT